MKLQKRGAAAPLVTLVLLFAAGGAPAAKLKMPAGMGGVPDIGAISCTVFNEMMVIGPLGTRHSLLTWAAGHYTATTGKSLEQLAAEAGQAGQTWNYDRLAEQLVAYCAANPKAMTSDAARTLAASWAPSSRVPRHLVARIDM